MKVKILTDAHHRVSSGVSQAFKAAQKPLNLPKNTAEALVARGVAETTGNQPSEAEE